MKKALLLFTLLASLGLNALTEKEKAIAFMKDWVTFANGKMEVYQRNVVTGKVISPVFVKLIESCLNSIVSNTGYIDQHHQR
jgi:hypothetical protein